jgi:hypothetical protein
MDHFREFYCIDCHGKIFSWADDLLQQRCAVCKWIYDQPNLTKEEIAEIRILTCTPILEKEDDDV